MEFTELMMMETDYFTSASLDWLQEEVVEADYGHYCDSLLLPVDSSAGWPIQQLPSSSSSEFAGTLINPIPSNSSVTNLGRGDDIVEAGGNIDKRIKQRRSRASSKKIPTTQRYINATAKNFKDLVQKHTGRPAVPPPFTMFFEGSNYPIKGPVTLSFGTGDAHYERYECDIVGVDQAGSSWHATDYNQEQQLQGYNMRY